MTRTRLRRLLIRAVNTVALAALVAAAFILWPRTLGGTVSYVKVSGTSMLPTFRNGDLVAVRSQSSYHAGDVIAYHIPHGEIGAGTIVIHRIVGGSPTTGYTTRGDNRTAADLWHPYSGDVLGRQWFKIDGGGNAMGRLRAPLPLAALLALVAGFAAYDLTKPRHPTPTPDNNTDESADESVDESVTSP